MMIQRRHRSRHWEDTKVRRHIAGLLRDYRGMLLKAGYRVIGRQVIVVGGHGSRGFLDRIRRGGLEMKLARALWGSAAILLRRGLTTSSGNSRPMTPTRSCGMEG